MAFQELVKGTPDWHEKYNSDFQDVYAQLGNKANVSEYIPPNSDLDSYTAEGTFFCPSRGTEIANIPPQTNSTEINGFSLCVLTSGAYGNGRIQYLTTYRSSQIYTRSYTTEWQTWKQLAIAEPPQVFELPLLNGFEKWQGTYKNVYYKTQSNFVTVHIAVQKAEGQISGANEIGKLPAGFLPDGIYHTAAYAFNPFQLAHIHVNATGSITARPDTTSNCILGTISFLAAH